MWVDTHSKEIPMKPDQRTSRTRILIGILACMAHAWAQEPDTSHLWLDVKDVSLRDVIQMVSKAHKLNVVLDPGIDCNVTLHIEGAPLQEGLSTLVKSCGFTMLREGSMVRIAKQTPIVRDHIEVSRNGRLDIDVENMDVKDFIREVNLKTGNNIVGDSRMSGTVAGKLSGVPFYEGMRTILEANGFVIANRDGIFSVSSAAPRPGSEVQTPMQVDCRNQTLSLSVTNAGLQSLLLSIGQQCNLQVIMYGSVDDRVNATLNNVSIPQALTILLGGTNYTFVQEDQRIVIGLRDAATPSGKALATSEVVELSFLKASDVLGMLPKNIPADNCRVVKEQNAIMITGSSEDIVRTRDFLRKVDVMTPQVVIDALVVEYSKNSARDLGLEMGTNAQTKTSISFPSIAYSDNTNSAKGILKDLHLDRVLGPLAQDFAVTLRLLETEGKARVLGRPSVTVLNGNQATINVGQTEYFKIVAGTSDNPTYRFEPITFGIKLSITPWVSKAGQITAVVAPEISNSMGANADGYPQIFNRSVSTTVRINDGETLVLGGLLRSEESSSHKKVPVFGDIPILGNLFKTHNKSRTETNLVIYITPHILPPDSSVSLSKQLRDMEADQKDGFIETIIGKNSEKALHRAMETMDNVGVAKSGGTRDTAGTVGATDTGK